MTSMWLQISSSNHNPIEPVKLLLDFVLSVVSILCWLALAHAFKEFHRQDRMSSVKIRGEQTATKSWSLASMIGNIYRKWEVLGIYLPVLYLT